MTSTNYFTREDLIHVAEEISAVFEQNGSLLCVHLWNFNKNSSVTFYHGGMVKHAIMAEFKLISRWFLLRLNSSVNTHVYRVFWA